MPICTINGRDIHYEVHGHGLPVLMIQGVGAAGSGWNKQVQGLAGGCQMLVFDHRGVGRSPLGIEPISINQMARDAEALMDAVGWESAHVVGHSMGGIVAQQLALNVPSRVRSLCLLCTFSKGRQAARLTPWVLWMTLRTRLGTKAARRRAFLGMLYPRSRLKGMDTAQLAAEVCALVGRDLAESPPILMKQLQAVARHDHSERLSELGRIPTLVISAKIDPIARVSHGRKLARAIPGAVFEIMQDAAHGVIFDQAEMVNRRLAVFFRDVESRRAKTSVPSQSS